MSWGRKKREGEGPKRNRSRRVNPRHMTPEGNSLAERRRAHRREQEVKRRDAKRRRRREE